MAIKTEMLRYFVGVAEAAVELTAAAGQDREGRLEPAPDPLFQGISRGKRQRIEIIPRQFVFLFVDVAVAR